MALKRLNINLNKKRPIIFIAVQNASKEYVFPGEKVEYKSHVLDVVINSLKRVKMYERKINV